LAKSIDIQRKLREQLDSLEELSGININIDALLKGIKTEVNKFIVGNQKNINKLLEVERGLNRVLNQQQSSMGTLEDNLKSIFAILTDIEKFSKQITKINAKIQKTSDVLESTNFDALKEFDMGIVTDFFTSLGKNFSTTKLNKLLKNVNSVNLDGLQIATDDLNKMDLSVVTSFLGTVNRLFSENKLNKMINKMSKTGNTQDFELVILYLKDMDVFLNDSIKYLNKMTNRIKNFVNKSNITPAGNVQNAPGGNNPDQKNVDFKQLFWFGAAMSLIRREFPTLFRVGEFLVSVVGGFVNAGKMVSGGFKVWGTFGEVEGAMAKTSVVLRGLVGVLGGLALAGGVVIAVFAMGIKKLLEGVEEAQKMRLEAASNARLNQLSFMGSSASGNVNPGGLLSRFAGASEERMIGAKAQMLARMGGSNILGSLTEFQAKHMAVMGELLDVNLDKMATLRDIMQNVQDIGFEDETGGLLGIMNRQGLLANRVVQDMTENLQQFVLYGASSFENLSSLANKLSVNVQSAIKLIEKFSTVSGAIDTSFGLSMVTGKFINPLSQFMEYAFGSPDKIFENVMTQVGDITKMNRIQLKFLSETLGMSVDELTVAGKRLENMKKLNISGEEEYKKQYKTLDDIVNSFGFQRLLGGISQILDIIEQEVMRGLFQNALEWIKKNGEDLPRQIQSVITYIKGTLLPLMVDVFAALGKGIVNLLGLLPFTGVSGTQADAISKSIDSFAGKIKSGIGTNTPSHMTENFEEKQNTNGTVVTSPRTSSKSDNNLLSSAIQSVGGIHGKQVSSQTTETNNGSSNFKVVSVKSDIKLDGYKVGEGLTELALEFG